MATVVLLVEADCVTAVTAVNNVPVYDVALRAPAKVALPVSPLKVNKFDIVPALLPCLPILKSAAEVLLLLESKFIQTAP